MKTEPSITELLHALTQSLSSSVEQPHRSALVLLASVLGKPIPWIIAHQDECLTPDQHKMLQALADRLIAGEPLAYLTGKQAFFEHDFIVSPAVLIPRPETELLVETANAWLETHPSASRILDVGTGSGCIPISILLANPSLSAMATDISPDALNIARQNAQALGVSPRISFEEANLLPSAIEKFDVVTANLPYVPSAKVQTINSVAWEPMQAMDGGEDGFQLIEQLLESLPPWLAEESLVLLEIEATLGQEALGLAQRYFPASQVTLHQDLAGLDRMVAIERKPS